MFNRLELPSHPISGLPARIIIYPAACSDQWTKPIWLQDLSIISLDGGPCCLAATATRSHFKFTPASDNLTRSKLLRSPDLPCPNNVATPRPSPDYQRWWILNKTLHWALNDGQMVAYLFLAAAARSLCLLFLNQLPTCVGVSPVAWASSLFLLGLG